MLEIDGVEFFKFPHTKSDERGQFTKIISHIVTPYLNIQEVFLSTTNKGIIRGMHLQTGPYGNNRIIACISGKVFDVLLDLRPNSKTFLKIYTFELFSKLSQAVYVPAGVAHGFQALEKKSKIIYFSDKVYSASFDTGITPLSFGVKWPIKVRGISKRDSALPTLSEYVSHL